MSDTPAAKRRDLQDHIAIALVAFRRETAIDPNPAHFQLRVHPDDYHEWLVSERARFAITAPKDLLGVQLVVDATVQYGHPVLRSTWEMVL